VLEKYDDTYAKNNLRFDGKWIDPLSPSKKQKRPFKNTLGHKSSKLSLTMDRSDDDSDEDEMTFDELRDRNQALREGLRQQLEIFEQYY